MNIMYNLSSYVTSKNAVQSANKLQSDTSINNTNNISDIYTNQNTNQIAFTRSLVQKKIPMKSPIKIPDLTFNLNLGKCVYCNHSCEISDNLMLRETVIDENGNITYITYDNVSDFLIRINPSVFATVPVNNMRLY